MWPFTPYSLCSSVSGSILWSSPLIFWSPAFPRRPSANSFGSKVRQAVRRAEAQRRSRTQLQGKRFEAHARSQGTPTPVFLVQFSVIPGLTPVNHNRPPTLDASALCSLRLHPQKVAPTVPTHSRRVLSFPGRQGWYLEEVPLQRRGTGVRTLLPPVLLHHSHHFWTDTTGHNITPPDLNRSHLPQRTLVTIPRASLPQL